MMKNPGLFLFVLVLCSVNTHTLFAQYENYKLKEYINPDYKRQSLDFSFNGDLRQNSTKATMTDIYKESTDDSGLSGGLGLGYHRIVNSVQSQNNTRVNLHFNGSSSKNKTEQDHLGLEKTRTGGQVSFDLSVNHQGYYYKRNGFFLLASPQARLDYLHYKSESDQKTSGESQERNIVQSSLAFTFGGGKGRIEQVGDARQAIGSLPV